MNHRVLYSAPGAGLGHLVRACAVGAALRDAGVAIRIITHSLYADLLRQITGLDIDFIPAAQWVSRWASYVDRFRPSLVVLDVFPWGIRGEALALDNRYPTVLLARRLKVDAYLKAAGLSWDASSPMLTRVIAAEPLNPDYLSLLRSAEADIRPLPGRIRFIPPDFLPPEPEQLTRLLECESVYLVVHSGPEHEVRRLIKRAREQGDAGAVIAAILPRPLPSLDIPIFHYFPAAVFYPRAAAVITGGGYNSLAETAPCPGRAIHVPFKRRYDDQTGRISETPPGSENGAPDAARLIADWI